MSILKGEPNPIYELGTVTYDNVSFNVASQDSDAFGLAFNNDGTKMFVLGYNSDSVHQYTLSTAFNLATASYDNVSFSVSGQDGAPTVLAFNNDGSKMFVLGFSSERVYQYKLSTPFNVGTASYDNVNFSVSSQDNSPYSLAFNDEGSKMFVVGDSSDAVYQYTLSTPFNVGTATYDNVSFSVGSQDNIPQGLTFNNDGTKMFIVGFNTNRVYQYTLSTPFNVGTASYDNVTFSVGSQDSGPTFLTFNNDGTKMFIVGFNTDSVYQYTNTFTPSSFQYPAIQNIYYGQPNNYLSFDGIDDYVEFNSSFNNSNTIILYDVNTYFSISKKIPNGHTSVIQYSFDSYPNGPDTQFSALTYVTESGSNYRYFRISDFDQKYDPSVNSKIEIDLDNLQVIIDDTNIYNFNIWLTSGSYIPWDQVNANVRLNFYNRESNNPTNFFIQSKLKLIEFYNDNNLLHQFEMNYIQNQLNDTVGNVVGTIVGATWVSEPNEVSRVYLGGALVYGQAPQYNVTFIDNAVADPNDMNSTISSSSYSTTNLLEVFSNNLIVSNHDLITFIRYWDENGNYLGRSVNDQDQLVTDELFRFNSNTIPFPSNAKYFRLNAYEGNNTSFLPNVTFSEFSQLTVSYQEIAQTNYSYTIIENTFYRHQDGTTQSNNDFNATSKIALQSNTFYFSDDDFSRVFTYDINDNYLGFYVNDNVQFYRTLNNYLGEISSSVFTFPSNVAFVALDAYQLSGVTELPQITLSEFSDNVYSYI